MKKIATPYTINFVANKIVATAAFMKKAGQYGSEEYTTIMNLRKELPNFTIEVMEEEKPNKKKGCLTLSTMEAYIIREFGENSDEIKEFNRVREASKEKKAGRYSYMMKWFHQVYPEGYKLLCEIDDGELKKQQRLEKARQTVENAFALRDAAKTESKENSGVTEKNSDETEENSADLD